MRENRAMSDHDLDHDERRTPGPKIGVRSLRTPRSAGIAGIAFSLLFTVTFVCTRLVVSADPTDAGSWLTDRRRGTSGASVSSGAFAGIAFLWFIGVVRSRIGDAEDRFFATVFLGSGLLFIALFLTSVAITDGLVESASGDGRRLADSGVWVAGRHISESTLEVALVMAGVFTTATSTILLRPEPVLAGWPSSEVWSRSSWCWTAKGSSRGSCWPSPPGCSHLASTSSSLPSAGSGRTRCEYVAVPADDDANQPSRL